MSLSNDPIEPLDTDVLPSGVTSRFVETKTNLRMHVLEAGDPKKPLVLLLHGFPELAYSWRKVMPLLADAGYHVVAPDQRGYGRTTGWDDTYDGDLRSFEILRLVRDVLALVEALGRSHVECLVGHDFGAVIAPWCALTRPDVFRALVVMSVPFPGPPQKLAPLMPPGSAIVLTTSIANVKGMPMLSAYAAAKAALRSLARSLAAELLPKGIRVNAISPGPIDTPVMLKTGMPKEQMEQRLKQAGESNPMKRIGRPEEIAKAAVFLAFDATFTNGHELPVDGGMTQL